MIMFSMQTTGTLHTPQHLNLICILLTLLMLLRFVFCVLRFAFCVLRFAFCVLCFVFKFNKHAGPPSAGVARATVARAVTIESTQARSQNRVRNSPNFFKLALTPDFSFKQSLSLA
jgi:hypothetical protein